MNEHELGTIIPNLQMQKLRLIVVGELAHRHTIGQWGSQYSRTDLSNRHPDCQFPHHAAYPDTVFA